jgi:CBS domain containing-hemolysin-like protein
MQTISLLIAHTSSTSINGTIIFSVLTILILLVCSAMISASEVAYFSMGPLEKEVLKNEEGKQAETAATTVRLQRANTITPKKKTETKTKTATYTRTYQPVVEVTVLILKYLLTLSLRPVCVLCAQSSRT